MSTTDVQADREAVFQAITEGRKVDPDVVKRIRDRSLKLRQQVGKKFDGELSVQLIREIRDE